jgi:hypothetical protein
VSHPTRSTVHSSLLRNEFRLALRSPKIGFDQNPSVGCFHFDDGSLVIADLDPRDWLNKSCPPHVYGWWETILPYQLEGLYWSACRLYFSSSPLSKIIIGYEVTFHVCPFVPILSLIMLRMMCGPGNQFYRSPTVGAKMFQWTFKGVIIVIQ